METFERTCNKSATFHDVRWYLVTHINFRWEKYEEEAKKLEKHFPNIDNPVLHGLINSLLIDSKTGCVLLGQRNQDQVNTAASLNNSISRNDAEWVKSLYQN